VGGQARDVLAAQKNAAPAGRREADDRADERGLADAVAAEHGERAVLGDGERDAVEDDRVAARGACDALRRTPVEVFLVRLVMAVVLLERWRVFPATAFLRGSHVPS